MTSRLTLIVIACATTACAGRASEDMSVAEHVASAGAEERAADEHDSDRAMGAGPNPCGVSTSQAVLGIPCWSDGAPPTEGHLAAAAEHRRVAAAHRAFAASLRDAESDACVGLSEDDRDTSPFEHTADVTNVVALTGFASTDEPDSAPVLGATVTLRAVRGLSAAGLVRVLACHLARNAALGHEVPAMPTCPLVPRGVSTVVRATRAGFEVDVRADTAEGAAEVLRRARLLVPPAQRVATLDTHTHSVIVSPAGDTTLARPRLSRTLPR